MFGIVDHQNIYFMRFKQWLEDIGLMQGGSYLPFGNNDRLAYGVQSKWVATDKKSDPDAGMRPAEKTFGFRSPEDLKASKERRAKTIDRSTDNKVVPMRNDRADIVY